jgi:hypothetical protein
MPGLRKNGIVGRGLQVRGAFTASPLKTLRIKEYYADKYSRKLA